MEQNHNSDGRWSYTWDVENRLVKMQALAWTQPAAGYQAPINPEGIPPNSMSAVTLEFKYDGLSRRVEKKTTIGTGTPELEGYLYDGWNAVMISKLNSDGSHNLRKWSCIWRPDVTSALYARSNWQKAGGVGGLAWMQTGIVQDFSYSSGNAEVHIPMQDHMGNVRHYYQFKITSGSVAGQVSANFEYDAFGREVRAWGTSTPASGQPPGLPVSTPWVDLLPFHFSTKFTDADSGLNYYGYRFYDPLNGRWLNRDPIEEKGGLNLYVAAAGQLTSLFDILGLDWSPGKPPATGNAPVCDGKGGVRPHLVGQAAKTCCGTCMDIHEQSHGKDALAANPNICKAADGTPLPDGTPLQYSKLGEQIDTEKKAFGLEIKCYKDILKECEEGRRDQVCCDAAKDRLKVTEAALDWYKLTEASAKKFAEKQTAENKTAHEKAAAAAKAAGGAAPPTPTPVDWKTYDAVTPPVPTPRF